MDPQSTSGTLVKDSTGAFSLAPGAGSNPTNAPSTPGIGNSDPYTIFNQNLAGILTQIQKASSAGAASLGTQANALTTEGVGAAGGYNPNATPGVNVQAQSGTLGAFAPAITDVNTQLSNANTAVSNLGTEVSGLETAYKPQAVSPGQSLVTPSGSTVLQGHSYTPEVNPETGLVDGFDQNTGTWASQDNAGTPGAAGNGGPTSGTPNAGISAIFGSSNPMGAYATDPNYVSEISGLYQTVASLGVTSSAASLQQYITNNAKGSPVTGQMVLNAAATYGIDPALLTTVLLHESDFGTAGAATTTNNPGNIGNTGASTQNYPSWQQGVMAAAKNLASRIAAAGGTANAPAVAGASATAPASTPASTDTSNVGGTFSTQAQAKVAQLPAAMQSYVDAGPLGVAYINNDRVPANLQQSVQTLAAKAGIPYVLDTDVGALKSITTVLDNLNNMQTLANKTLASGTLGHIWDTTVGQGEQMLQTGTGIQLGLFDNYRDVAIKAVQALAGGAGSGLRINMGEIAANTQNLPQATDSKENAIAQIQQLKQLIYTQLSTTFPYATVPVNDPNGTTGTIPISNLSTAISQGYTIQ